ncbi:hypothetical protein NBRC110019_31640 [Neptunitalea chrysea]|uniref:Por secretion system C-terminal sorting domain-containing protein n=1 Tax=Neptunitalea chrysea TaxID=1647581 RepID=A0A9W6B7N0_9FLAO|nr:endonuclease [Neptunitalea chrysea]GLB54123.1 hypothetical protein NBRC110019_31640 [Neptunitalea chrysea]
MRKALLLSIFLAPFLVIAQMPAYYSGINFNMSEASVKTQLANLITVTHTTDFPYTSSSTDTWDLVKLTDENPADNTQVLLFYGYDDTDGNTMTDYTRDKSSSCHTSGCIGLWTREHVYAKSIATPSLVTNSAGSGTDVHNLRACDGSMNSSRSNRIYTSGTGTAHIVNSNYWYPGDEWKGDVARIIMYMYLRYPTQCLANNIGNSSNTYSTDMPDIFLQWNAEDPVTAYETQRNTVLEAQQGNRNPFIDNPYLATFIWGGTDAEDTWGTLGTTTVAIQNVQVYPTNVHTRLYISNVSNNQYTAAVYTMQGQQTNLNLVNNSYINVNKLKDGIYILELQNTQGDSKTFKFVKN